MVCGGSAQKSGTRVARDDDATIPTPNVMLMTDEQTAGPPNFGMQPTAFGRG